VSKRGEIVCYVDLYVLQTEKSSYEGFVPKELTPDTLHSVESVFDFMCVVSGDQQRSFLMSCGVSKIFFTPDCVLLIRVWK
jgi:hypothetical protein